MRITMCDYSSRWPSLFNAEKIALERSISLPVRIEHIGSTSVPGLCAKPIIDILIGVTNFSQIDIPVPQIRSLEYEYVADFEDVMPHRRFFRKMKNGVRTHHIHMVEEKSTFWIRHLKFRDYLCDHPQIAAEYATLKRQLAEKDWKDINDYADAKTDFIRRIESLACGARS